MSDKEDEYDLLWYALNYRCAASEHAQFHWEELEKCVHWEKLEKCVKRLIEREVILSHE